MRFMSWQPAEQPTDQTTHQPSQALPILLDQAQVPFQGEQHPEGAYPAIQQHPSYRDAPSLTHSDRDRLTLPLLMSTQLTLKSQTRQSQTRQPQTRQLQTRQLQTMPSQTLSLPIDCQPITVAEWHHLLYRLEALEADRAHPFRSPVSLSLDPPSDRPLQSDVPVDHYADHYTDSRPARPDRRNRNRRSTASPMIQMLLLLSQWLLLALFGFVLAVYFALSWNQVAIAGSLWETFQASWRPLLSLLIGVGAIVVSRESLRTS
ncbi:MAG: hypothetical protein VKJ24_19620 [Synechococcales bacterium]|nr:hypothetical protein [Synechococcales bacterium]